MKTADLKINNTNVYNKRKLLPNSYKKVIEKISEGLFFISTCISVLSVFSILIFILLKGGPAILKVGISDFLLGSQWIPEADIYGIKPMVVASLYATIGAILISVPIGVLTAVFLAEIAPRNVARIVKPAVELLAGIPSVVYGFFGLLVIVPIIQKYIGGVGNSLLATIIILGIMILPTIINISCNSIKSLPKEYREGSLALGSSKIQTIFKVLLPAASSGILTSVVLGIGRAIGETMAVILVSGNTVVIPHTLTDRVRTLTANIAIEMGYAYGLHQEMLFATGVILLIFIMILNLSLNLITRKKLK
ncbi:phosphate ABC transporter permease subunit PstC [Clostridiaceae bacterium M8S5]|nr:phosphate ABC transporter permease subunit PstC [Clostridiaceae bacterium M8S5]